jgi:hypothetical protein
LDPGDKKGIFRPGPCERIIISGKYSCVGRAEHVYGIISQKFLAEGI